MSRFLIILLPLILTVGATILALRIPHEGSYIQKAVTGAIVVGLFFSGITWWIQPGANKQNAANDAYTIATSAKPASADCKTQSKLQEQQIESLNEQLAELKAGMEVSAPKAGAADAATIGPKASEGAGIASASVQQSTPLGQRVFWTQDRDNQSKGAYAYVRFKTYASIDAPGFVAICERPCSAVAGQADPASQGTPLVGATERNVAAFVFTKPKPMPLGTTGYITLRSLDKGPVKVTSFRLLQPSEMPADLR